MSLSSLSVSQERYKSLETEHEELKRQHQELSQHHEELRDQHEELRDSKVKEIAELQHRLETCLSKCDIENIYIVACFTYIYVIS
jgi:predicted nuclease with TOPRIM domain